MKISVDGQCILELSETQKKVIMHDIPEEIFHEDMCRRLCYILQHKHDQCLERLKKEWLPKLRESGVRAIPTDDQELAELIFAQPTYLNRTAREAKNGDV